MLQQRDRTSTSTTGAAAVAIALGLFAVPQTAFAQGAGCSKDTECKGERVCVSGQCVDPAPAASPDRPPPPYGPPAGPPTRRGGSYYDYKVQVAQDPRLIKDWSEGDPIPEGYIKTTRIRTGLIAGGASLFGGLYVLSVITGAAAYDVNRGKGASQDNWPLFIPVVGPFIDLGTARGLNASLATLLIIDGLGQSAGVAMIIAGAAAPKTVLVRVAGVELRPAPIVAKDMRGFAVTGTF